MAETQTSEQQIESLNKQVTDLTKKSEQKDRTIEQQKGRLESQGRELAQVTKERDQAKTEIGEKVGRIRELELEGEAKEATIQGYQQKLLAAEAASDGRPVVKHEEKLYRVVVPQFHFENQLVKAAELSTNPALVEKLVKAGSGVLEPVEG